MSDALPPTASEPAPFQPIDFGTWESTPEAARVQDPLQKIQAYDDRLRKDLFRAGLYDEQAEAEIVNAGADQALRQGLIASPEEYAPAPKPRDPAFFARQFTRAGDSAKAQDIFRYQSFLSRPDTDPETLERARKAAEIDPATENELVRKAVRAGELPFAVVLDAEGNPVFEIDPELGALDRGQILDLAGDDIDARYLPQLEKQLTRVEGLNYTPAQVRQAREFDSFLAKQAAEDPFLGDTLEKAQTEYNRSGQLSEDITGEIDRALAALDPDNEFAPATRSRLIRDMIKRAAKPEDFNPENPEQHVQYLEDGSVWLPEQVIFNQSKHDALLDKLSITPEQKEAAKKIRQGRLDAIAPAMVDAMGADPDALEFFEKSKAAGKTDAEIATEWYSKPENYSSFTNRARSFGMSLIEAGPGLFQSVAALAGSESAREALAARAQDMARNEEFARLFGDSYGVGQSLLNTGSQVAADLLAGIAVSAVATPAAGAGILGARTAASSLIRGIARTAAREGSIMAARQFLRTGTGTAARTLASLSDDVVGTLARTAGQQTGIALSSFTRSAGSAYVQAYSALDAQTNSQGQPLYSDEEKRKIALGTALTAGTSTAAITLGFGKLLGPGVEGLVSGKIGTGVLRRVFGMSDDQIVSATRESALAILKSAGAEAPEEAVDQLVGNVIQAIGTGEEFRLGPALKEALEAGLVGGLLGASTKAAEIGIDRFRSPKVVALEKAGAPASAAALEAKAAVEASTPTPRPVVINQDGLRIQDNPPLSPDPFTYGEEDPDAPNLVLEPMAPLSYEPGDLAAGYGDEPAVGITDTGGAVRVSVQEIDAQIDAVDVQLADLKVTPEGETEGQKIRRTRRVQQLNAEKVRLKAAAKNAKASGGFVYINTTSTTPEQAAIAAEAEVAALDEEIASLSVAPEKETKAAATKREAALQKARAAREQAAAVASTRRAAAPVPRGAEPQVDPRALDYGDGGVLTPQDNTLAGQDFEIENPAGTDGFTEPDETELDYGDGGELQVQDNPLGSPAPAPRAAAAPQAPAKPANRDAKLAAEMLEGRPIPEHQVLFDAIVAGGWIPERNALTSILGSAGFGGTLYVKAFIKAAGERIASLYPVIPAPKVPKPKTLKSLGLGDVKAPGGGLASIPVNPDGLTAPFTNDPQVTAWQKAAGLSVKVPDGVAVNPAISVNPKTGFVNSATGSDGRPIFSKGDFKRPGSAVGDFVARNASEKYAASLNSLPPADFSQVAKPVLFVGFEIKPGETTEDDLLAYFLSPIRAGDPSRVDLLIEQASPKRFTAAQKDAVRAAAHAAFLRDIREFTLPAGAVPAVDTAGFGLKDTAAYRKHLANRARVWSTADRRKDGTIDTTSHWNGKGRPAHPSIHIKSAIKAVEAGTARRPDTNAQIGSDDVSQDEALERAASRNLVSDEGDAAVVLDAAFTPDVLRGLASATGGDPSDLVGTASGVATLIEAMGKNRDLRKVFEKAYVDSLDLTGARRGLAVVAASKMEPDELLVVAGRTALVRPDILQAIRGSGFFQSLSYGVSTWTDAEIEQHRADNRKAVTDLKLDGDLRPALERIARSATFPRRYRAIALAALKMQVLPTLAIVDAPAEAYAGSYLSSRNLVTLNLASSNGRGLLDVLCHELLHAATVEAVANPRTRAARDLRDKLERARLKAADVVPSDMAYAVSSLDEFIAHSATDPRLQVILRETFEKGKSTWQRVVEAIAKFFGIANNDFVSDLWGFINHAAEHGYRTVVAASREVRSEPGTDWTRQDAEYLAAVERGDMETAQRMVDEAAREAGYDIGPVYHGSRFGEPWTQFKPAFDSGLAPYSLGLQLSTSKSVADSFGEARAFFARLSSPLDTSRESLKTYDTAPIIERLARVDPSSLVDGDAFDTVEDAAETIQGVIDDLRRAGPQASGQKILDVLPGIYAHHRAAFLQLLGFDSVRHGATDARGGQLGGSRKSTTYGVFSPEQIKSADPVTRDDNGNVIPLSARFRPSSPDIRYSMPARAAVDQQGFYSQLERLVEAKIPNRATPQQILATVDPTRGSGVKAEELKWTGFEQAVERLASENGGVVPKDRLLDHLRNEGAVKFEEVTQGGELSDEEVRKDAMFRLFKEGTTEADLDEMEWEMLTEEEGRIRESAAEKIRYGQYVLPGGTNYREVVLAMPDRNTDALKRAEAEYRAAIKAGATETELDALSDKVASLQPSESYTSSHFPDIPNYVAHMRTNERVDADGKHGLFIEEIQSDRHQAGRKQGYLGEPVETFTVVQDGDVFRVVNKAGERQQFPIGEASRGWNSMFSSARNRADAEAGLAFLQARSSGEIADAPFRKDWPLQMFKRALRDAVASGKDWIGWTVGDTQNDRFDLSKQVDAILIPYIDAERRNVSIYLREDLGDYFALSVTNDGTVTSYDGRRPELNGKSLDDVIGKDMADKIMSATEEAEFRGDGLKVGGSGMKGFYDNMLPKEIGKYVKQWGGKVEKSNLPGDKNRSVNTILAEDFGYRGIGAARNAPEEIKEKAREMQRTGLGTPIWRIEITPEMRAGVAQGQPRFAPAPTGTPQASTTSGIDQHLPQLPAGLTYAFDDTRPKYLAYARRSQPGIVTVNKAALAKAVAGLDPANARAIVRKVVNHEIAHLAAFRAFTDAELSEMASNLSLSELADIARTYYGGPDAMQRLTADLASGTMSREALVEEWLRSVAEMVTDGGTTEEAIAFHSANPGFVARVLRYIRDYVRSLWTSVAGPKEDYATRVSINRLMREYREIKRGHMPPVAEPFDTSDPYRDNKLGALYEGGGGAAGLDAEYLDAVERADMAVAQKMVDQLVLETIVPGPLRKPFASLWASTEKLGETEDEQSFQPGQRAAVSRANGRVVKALESYFEDQNEGLALWRAINDARKAVKYTRDGDVVPLSTRFSTLRGALAPTVSQQDPEATVLADMMRRETFVAFDDAYNAPDKNWKGTLKQLLKTRTGDPRFEDTKNERTARLNAANQLLNNREIAMTDAMKAEKPDRDLVNRALGDSSPTIPTAIRKQLRADYEQILTDIRDYFEQESAKPDADMAALARQEKEARREAYREYDSLRRDALVETARAKKTAISAAMEELTSVAPRTAAAVRKFRSGIDELSKVMRDTHPDDSFLHAVIDENLGVYITRTYRAHHGDGDPLAILKSDDPADIETVAAAERIFVDTIIDGRAEDIVEEEAKNDRYISFDEARKLAEDWAKENEVGRKMLEDYIASHGVRSFYHGGGNFKIDLQRYMQKVDVPEALRKVLGEVEDPVENAARTFANVSYMAANHRFIEDLARGGKATGALVTAEQKAGFANMVREPDEDKYLQATIDLGFARRKGAAGYVKVAEDIFHPTWLVKARADRDFRKLEEYQVIATTNKRYGAGSLDGLYAAPLIKAFFDNSMPADPTLESEKFVHRMGSFFAKATGASLGIATVTNPAFHVRNLLGGALFLGANGVNPFAGMGPLNKHLVDLMMNRDNPEVTKRIALGIYSDDIRPQAIKELIKDEIDKPGDMSGFEWFGNLIGGKRGLEIGKKITAGTLKLTDLAGAIDSVVKGRAYETELETLKKAYPDKPEAEVERMAADIVRRTMQSRSKTVPVAEDVTRSNFGRLFAPFLRFKAEMFRVTHGTIAQGLEEMKSDNPVIRARGQKRIAGFVSVAAFSLAGPALLSAMLGVGEDEEIALREALPPYLRGNSIIYKISDGNVTSYDLTYINPFSMIFDPVSRSARAMFRGEPEDAPAEVAAWIHGQFLEEQIAAGAMLEVLNNRTSDNKPITLETDSFVDQVGKYGAHLFGSAYTPQVLKILDRAATAQRRGVPEDAEFFETPFGLLSTTVIPARPRTYETSEMALRSFKSKAQTLRDIRTKQGRLKMRQNLDEQDINDIVLDQYESMTSLYEDLDRIARGYGGLGMDRASIIREMVNADHSRGKARGVVVAGVVPAPALTPATKRDLFEAGQEVDPNGGGERRVRTVIEAQRALPRVIDLRGPADGE